MPADLAALGFVAASEIDKPRLILCTQGKEKRGKDHFAFTAPGPIGVISQDIGTKGVVEKFVRQGKKIYLREHQPTQELMIRKASEKEYEKEYKALETEYRGMLKSPNLRTVVMDTGSDWWETMRLAEFGKLSANSHHYVEVNARFRELIREGFEYDKNVIWIHRVKKRYVKKKDSDKGDWDGNYDLAGFSEIPFLCEITLNHVRETVTNDEGQLVTVFGIEIVDSRYQGAELIGQTFWGDECDFGYLAVNALPEVDPSAWI